MPSFVVTGASRGLGFGFINKLSFNPDNVVIGFVRNEEAARKKVEEKLHDRKNLHIFRGDLDDYQSMKDAFEKTSKITGGSLDYLIANAGVSSSGLESLTELGANPSALEKEAVDIYRTNVVGNINLINLALPLIEKGIDKKIVVLSTGLGDPAFSADYDIFESPFYSISKAAVDMVVAKYHAEHHGNGILIMAISPGVVDSGSGAELVDTPEAQQKPRDFFRKFMKYAPHFGGPDSVETSVNNVLSVVDKATIENNGGKVVSHFGNKQWL